VDCFCCRIWCFFQWKMLSWRIFRWGTMESQWNRLKQADLQTKHMFVNFLLDFNTLGMLCDMFVCGIVFFSSAAKWGQVIWGCSQVQDMKLNHLMIKLAKVVTSQYCNGYSNTASDLLVLIITSTVNAVTQIDLYNVLACLDHKVTLKYFLLSCRKMLLAFLLSELFLDAQK